MPTIYPGISNSIPITSTTTGPSNVHWAWEVRDEIANTSLDHATALGATGANGWKVDASGTSNLLVTPPVGFAADTDTDRYKAYINRTPTP